VTSRVFVTFASYLVSLVIVAAIAFFLVLISAGPHAGLLPDWAENAVLLLGWVSVIVLPIITARKVWRSRGII
jgi:hypothetical protein